MRLSLHKVCVLDQFPYLFKFWCRLYNPASLSLLTDAVQVVLVLVVEGVALQGGWASVLTFAFVGFCYSFIGSWLLILEVRIIRSSEAR